MKLSISSLMTAALMMTGCLGAGDVMLSNHNPVTPIDPATGLPVPPAEQLPEEPAEPPPPPARCDMGKTYTGFAGTMLEAGRVDNDLGLERSRVKPYTALVGEYQRVLGNNPALIGQSATTFGQDANRWLTEPTSSAVTVYSAYRVAFQGCLTVTTNTANTRYQTLPSNTTAATECASWARKFWSRDATQTEIDACVQVAMVDTTREGMNTNPAANRRWAYTCASVLSAAGFMTY
jgi:hypothetical protein